jgi:hypothetical protein
LNAKKEETMTYGIGNPCPDLGQVFDVAPRDVIEAQILLR